MVLVDAEMERVAQDPLRPEEQQITQAIVQFLGFRPQVKFTPHVVSTWCRTLGIFPITVVNRAMIEIGLSAKEFVGLQDIFLRCRELSRDNTVYQPHRNEREIPLRLIYQIAERNGLDAGQSSDKTHHSKRMV